MPRRSSVVIGTGLVTAAIIAGYLPVHEKTSKHDQRIDAGRGGGDPWTSSPWVAGSQHATSIISEQAANAKPAPRKPLQSAGAAPITDASRLGETAPSGEGVNAASGESLANALNVKLPPLVAMSSSVAGKKPRAWGLISTAYAAANCRFSADDIYVHTGQYSALLQYDGSDPKLRCIFGQVSQAGAFGGSRVQFSAFMAGRGVVGGAGLVFRADDAEGNIVAYNFIGQPTFSESRPWGYDVVIVDVPKTAAKLCYGAWLGPGGGSLWVDTVEFHIVDNSFPVTHPPPAQSRKSGAPAFQPPAVPSNLDFEDTDPVLH